MGSTDPILTAAELLLNDLVFGFTTSVDTGSNAVGSEA